MCFIVTIICIIINVVKWFMVVYTHDEFIPRKRHLKWCDYINLIDIEIRLRHLTPKPEISFKISIVGLGYGRCVYRHLFCDR